jgi:hypothetical protein
MVTHEAPHQPYLLTCADPHKPLWEDEDTEEWDGPGDCTIDWAARAEYERRMELNLGPDWRGRAPYVKE